MSVVEVLDASDASRFEVYVDHRLAGFAEYRDRGLLRSFSHTEIAPPFQGRGLSIPLIGEALDATRGAGYAVLPYCPAVRGFIVAHQDYLDLVPVERRADFDLGGAA